MALGLAGCGIKMLMAMRKSALLLGQTFGSSRVLTIPIEF